MGKGKRVGALFLVLVFLLAVPAFAYSDVPQSSALKSEVEAAT